MKLFLFFFFLSYLSSQTIYGMSLFYYREGYAKNAKKLGLTEPSSPTSVADFLRLINAEDRKDYVAQFVQFQLKKDKQDRNKIRSEYEGYTVVELQSMLKPLREEQLACCLSPDVNSSDNSEVTYDELAKHATVIKELLHQKKLEEERRLKAVKRFEFLLKGREKQLRASVESSNDLRSVKNIGKYF